MTTQRSTQACALILREAEHLLHIQGYHCTSLEDIAARCKMTKANLLHHFQSKEDLGLAVLDYKMKCYRDGCLNPVFADNVDPLAAVSELFKRSERFYRENGCKAGCFVANMALEMSDLSARFRKRAAQYFEEWVTRIERLLRLRRNSGYFAPSLKPRACAEAILSLYEGAIMLARTRRDPTIFERVGRIAVEMLEAHQMARSLPRKPIRSDAKLSALRA